MGCRVLFLGSSVTFGYASNGYGIADYFKGKYDWDIECDAVSGTTLVDTGADSYVSRLKNHNEKYDFVICQLSTNDASKKLELGGIGDNTKTITGAIEEIIRYSKSSLGAKVIFFTSARFDSSSYQEMVDRLYEIKRVYKIDIIDMWNDDKFNKISIYERGEYMADDIHPTKDGYDLWWCPYIEKKLKVLMKPAFIKLLLSIPWWGYLTGLFFFGLQYLTYRTGDFISHVIGTADNAICPKIPMIDDRIPLIPAFVIIYAISYAFWVIGPIASSMGSRKTFINGVILYFASYFVGMLVFIFMPTYMDREAEGLIEYVSTHTGAIDRFLKFTYSNDGWLRAFNLFPSFHCLLSFLVFLIVKDDKNIHIGYKIYAVIGTILICMSTVFVKQHYIMDVVSGLVLPLILYFIVKAINPSKWIMKKYGIKEKKY